MNTKKSLDQYFRVQIHKKLTETQDAFIDEDLQDYIMVLVANKKSKSQMKDDLSLFLNESTDEFVEWLHDELLDPKKKPQQIIETNSIDDNSIKTTTFKESISNIDSKTDTEKQQTIVHEEKESKLTKEKSKLIQSKIVFIGSNNKKTDDNEYENDDKSSEKRRIKLKRNFVDAFIGNESRTNEINQKENNSGNSNVEINLEMTSEEEDDNILKHDTRNVISLKTTTQEKDDDLTPPPKRFVKTKITGPNDEKERKSKELQRLIRFGCPINDDLVNINNDKRIIKTIDDSDSKLVVTLNNKQSTDNDVEMTLDDVTEKVEERCKYWPNCKNGDECEYHHPTIPCKMFPNCHFGERCLYIHPNCKFDTMCTKKDCPYQHQNKKITCKFFPNCTNQGCPFIHPNAKSCLYGSNCTNKMCPFTHSSQSAPVAKPHQLKWSAKDNICSYTPETKKTIDTLIETN